MRKRRDLFLLVRGPSLEAEHISIGERLQQYSGGDFVDVFKETMARPGSAAHGDPIPFSVAYMFSTEVPPSELDFGLLNGDRVLLLELGDLCWIDGYSRARSWLDRRRE